MWVSTRAQYGMRALVEIALGGDEPVSLKTVAERQNISQHYLEQIVAELRRHGLVDSVRGAHGGYRLARPMNEIAALEVVELMEGSVAPVSCIEDAASCSYTGHCSTEGLWRRVDEAVREVLSATSLADLVKERKLLQLEPLPEMFSSPRP
jgi:Rrf2 family transcriptional regulator, cysteine metabolism repressor